MDKIQPFRVAGRNRRMIFFVVPLLTVILFGLVFTWYFFPSQHPTRAHASGLTPLTGDIPALVGRSQLLGATDASTPVTLMVGLRLRNQASLESYVKSISGNHALHTPHMTLDQLVKAYGPLPKDEQAVIAYMQQAGFTLTNTYKHHLLLGFQGTIGQAENLFQLQVNNYRAPSGRQFYAPSSNPMVLVSLAAIIQSVNGLDDVAHYGHPPVVSPNNTNAVSANSVSCVGPSTTPAHYFIPNQIASDYNLNGLYNAGFHGEGQSVALFELDDYVPSDISAYTSCYGGSAVPIRRVTVAGGAGAPGMGALEVELDMELVLSAAPHLAQLLVYEAPNSGTGVLQEWSQIVSEAVPVVSTSWGACEQIVTQAEANTENAFFLIAAAQGQSIFAASGDHATDDCQGQVTGVTESVDDPASQPYVTGVGGTSLSTTTGSYNGEHAWEQGRVNGRAVGGGGGISTFWTQPSWQQGPGVNNSFSSAAPCAANTGNTGSQCREVPDVSLNADPNVGYVTYCTASKANCASTHPWTIVGGTSAAAPMWAAMTALANEKSLRDGNFNLGFLNPYLYAIAQNGGSYASDFNDITAGTSNVFNDGKYPTTPNYDMVTGLGSYKAQQLANDLEIQAANQSHARSAPANTTWYFAEGSVGGSFQEYITILNPNTTQTATVNITYLFENKPAVTITRTVAPSTRYTESANGDLHIQPANLQQAISAIVQSNVPIVAERPMYFNLRGVPSGTDVVGATNATHTSFYFAEGDTRIDSTRNYSTFITLLNPSTTQTAHVTINYYSGGLKGTQTVSVGPLQRGTATPASLNLHQQVAIEVMSDIGIVSERPMYFSDNVPNAGGRTTGAASAVGATSPGNDWLFAEGFTGTNFQEYLVLANFSTSSTTANVRLEYDNGSTQSVPVTIAAQSQYYFDVNNASSHPASGCGCTPTGDVSAEVTSSASIVAERLMYFHFSSALVSGGTDVVGEAGPASHSVYAFAEGFTYGSFNEFLTLQNPTNNAEDAAITLFADGTIVQVTKHLAAHSRTTIPVNSLVVPMANAYPIYPIGKAFEVSMDVQALNGGVIVAERPMYFNYQGDPGGTDVIGYTGG